jgi:HlyD family secretion protein
VAVLEKERQQALAQLEQVKTNRQRGTMTSPIDGVVLSRPVTNERHQAAGTVLLEIGRLEDLEVEAEVLSQEVVEIEVGQDVEIYGPAIGRMPAHGKVSRIYPAGFTKISSLGVEQQRVMVIVQFEPEELSRLRVERELGVGFRVNVKIFTAASDRALVIPRSALFRGTAGDWQVFAIRDGRARLTSIEVGLMNDELVEVIRGLEENDQVIIAPESSLVDGTRVTRRER